MPTSWGVATVDRSMRCVASPAAVIPGSDRLAPDAPAGPRLPPARGPLTAALFAALRGDGTVPPPSAVPRSAALHDEDVQLALYAAYELHYRGFSDVEAEAEWDLDVLRLRAALERATLRGVETEVATALPALPSDPVCALIQLAGGAGGPSLSEYAATCATLTQLRELCVHRSAYQRKEADPHTWALPRFGGAAKAALVEIQVDEYGNGVEAEMHAELFALTMEALGLDAEYGRHLDLLPAVTLATTNLISLFGLHRRWRGALIGHLALFEMTSRVPMARYSAALRRVGVGAAGRRFYDVHVAVDAHHEHVAIDELVPAVLRQEPQLASDVIFGAAALSAVEARFSRSLLDAWGTGGTSLRRALPPA